MRLHRACRRSLPSLLLVAPLLGLPACGRGGGTAAPVLRLSGSTVGAEGALLARQKARFEAGHPGVRVVVQSTPDDASQRHELYVQWLNARVGRPDVLQIDVVWTAEFAAAGWILPLDRFRPDTRDFFPATVEADTWAGRLYAIPWFVDVGLLYRRTDVVPREPRSLDDLVALAQGATSGAGALPYGILWQGARYEGLVAVFLEYLGGFGGRLMNSNGRIVVDSPAGIRALSFMRDELYRWHVAPLDLLTWHEEETRLAFENGEAAFMRNWPYAAALLRDPVRSRVAGRFAVSPMPAAPGGRPTSTLGGAALAVNARSRFPEEAFALACFLSAPAQMLERAEVLGEYPARRSVFADPRLGPALSVPVAEAERAIESAVARPVTPIYSELSGLLQVAIQRTLARQDSPAHALGDAARRMNALVEQAGLPSGAPERGAPHG